jgi:uncharacterized ion transporter superfamily protein YfcC
MPVAKHGGFFHPVVMMLVILGAVTCLTHLLPAGSFDRKDGLVIPGTYHLIEKAAGIEVIFGPRAATGKVTAASLIDAFLAIPKGFTKSTSIITMVLLVGGLFGVLRRSGAIDAGIDWLATRFATRIHLLVVILMCVLGLGSTFLGFISEYLVFIPAVVMLAGRLGYPPLVGLAIVTVAAKIGYAASVTNPLALAVAQPLAGVPLFSGLEYRALVFAVFLCIGIAWVFALIKKSTPSTKVDVAHQAKPLSLRHRSVLSVFLLGMGLLIVGARTWAWSSPEFGAFYVALALLIAVVSGLTVTAASDAFVDGMKSMILAALLIAMASAVDVLLQSAMVLDTIVNAAVELTSEQSAAMVASGLMGTEMVLDVFIPSVSGKAAVSMPILVPIAQAAGVAPNTLILAFVLGSGLTNMVTPTSGMLLAFISAAGVTYRQWIAFVFPLFLALSATGVVMLWILALMTAP